MKESAKNPDHKILNTPARVFVEKWIKDPERTKEELEAGINLLTRGCTEELDVGLITPEMLKKLNPEWE